MNRTRIKICGITRPEDARIAACCGADAIGLVFYPGSPRHVSVEQARECLAALPPFVSAVALFVDETADRIAQVLEEVAVDIVQFHGSESESFCKRFGRPYIKALRVKPPDDPAVAAGHYGGARGILLDAWDDAAPGGTGKTFDWQLAGGAFPRPLILAGGLSPDNVEQALEQLRPAAVDVSSGVESAPGVKCETKMGSFIAAVRAADQRLYGLNNE